MRRDEKRLLIHDAEIVNEGESFRGSILITGERITEIIRDEEPLPSADEVLEAEGLLCLPGVIDMHVHFREPGLTAKGSITSESGAALLGGVTSYAEMPNTLPQTTTLETWEDKMRRAEEESMGNYSFMFGATNENVDLLSRLDLKHTPGVKVFMGSSTGNMLVDSPETLRRIFTECPTLICIHSEDEEIILANKAKYTALYGDDPEVKFHPLIRSREACYECSRRAVAMAEETGARLHILHLSTEDELSLLRPRTAEGFGSKRITGEVCVHYLWFTDKDYERLGARVKWNPAIKTERDRAALRAAINSGLVDVVSTDHSPHLPEEKVGGALEAKSGGPLVQFSLPLMLELVREGIFPIERVVEYMAHNPALLYGIEERGFIRKGYYADLVLVDPHKSTTVTKEVIRSKCGWSPFEGETFRSSVVGTILNGAPVVRGGVLDEALALRSKRALTFGNRLPR